MTTEYQQIKTAFIRTLMTTPGHTLVEHQGRRQPASVVLQALLRGEEAEFHAPATAVRNGAPNLAPSSEAVAGLSDEHRAALESGDGINGFTRTARPIIRASQEEGDHGVVQTKFFFRQDGVATPGSGGPTHQDEGAAPAKPTVRTESGAPTKTTFRPGANQRDPWGLLSDHG